VRKWADRVLPPLAGVVGFLAVWWLVSAVVVTELPSPLQTWSKSKLFIVHPFEKRGEMDQGILRFAWYSLQRVAKGFGLAIAIGAPLGFALGLSRRLSAALEPIIAVLRPVSPLAWLPLGLILFKKPAPAATFTIAMCSMWPTVLNTALGVRSIPEEYRNVARVLNLSRWQTLRHVLLPAALPMMFAGFRLSLGIAWLVIVAAEMLTGAPGIGGFLWQEYNALIIEHIILCIVTIGLIGFVLDRMMILVEARLKGA
jgi:nitrate/nitrite transport system permease protein